MRVLIVGEYSGFSKNLKTGFLRNGCEAVVISYGDGFKAIKQRKSDIDIDLKNINFFSKALPGTWRVKTIYAKIKLIRELKRRKFFDYIIIINPTFIGNTKNLFDYRPSISFLKSRLNDKENIFLSLCGNDVVFNSYIKKIPKKSSFEKNQYKKATRREMAIFKNMRKEIKYVIPVMYTYAIAYRESSITKKFKLTKTIPLPIDVSKFSTRKKKKGAKTVIFHGVNRPGKGSEIIIEALGRIKKKYANEVSIKIVSHLPYNRYLLEMQEADIIVDQCHSLSYGMNAIIAMSMGKVVLSGNEEENKKEFNRYDIPVVNIQPDPWDIYNKISFFLENKNLINEIGVKSRCFVESFHDCKTVSKKYLEEMKRIKNE